MKFNISYDNQYTNIEAIPENNDEKFGLRAQGPYTKLNLKNNILKMKYVPKKKLHPDIIGALCLTAFYPFIKYEATMPEPVSQTFANNFDMDLLCQHDLINGNYSPFKPIKIKNINSNLEKYNYGTETVVAYGGGIDSTAIACLFPEFNLVHTSTLNTTNEVKNVMKDFIMRHLNNKSYIIDSNCTELTQPGGFTTFTNIFLVPLLLTSDLNIKNICCGEILESACLMNGKKYFPQFNEKKRNKWIRFYNNIGLNVFSPTAGCSELITSKIIYKNNLHNDVLFCERNNGHPCYKCTKCLRKILQLNYHGCNFKFDQFQENFITKSIKQKPEYFANLFKETTYQKNNIPDYIKNLFLDFKDLKTYKFNKIYKKSFLYFPEDIKDILIKKLKKYSDLMNEEEEKDLESWDLSKLI